VDRTLNRLLDAARALESESTVVELGARVLFEACPRGLGFAYTIRGHPARSVGAAILYAEGREIREVDLERFRRVYGHAQLYYDRTSVSPDQRGRWTDLPGDWFRHSPFYAIFRPYGRMGRALVCLGARPLACAGLLLPNDQRALTEGERRSLQLAARRSSGLLRITALLAQAEAALDGVEHLLSRSSEAAFLLSAGGLLLACSSPGQRALERWPRLSESLAEAVRQARSEAVTVDGPAEGLEIHVTPCTPRGSAAGYLAVVGGSRASGRDRLSPRETQLVGWLEQGLANAAIAERMGLAPTTVKTMLERLYRKLGVSGRVALLHRLRDRGLAPLFALPS
jgi:DNA-binding CsgD family transcriptional regulator